MLDILKTKLKEIESDLVNQKIQWFDYVIYVKDVLQDFMGNKYEVKINQRGVPSIFTIDVIKVECKDNTNWLIEEILSNRLFRINLTGLRNSKVALDSIENDGKTFYMFFNFKEQPHNGFVRTSLPSSRQVVFLAPNFLTALNEEWKPALNEVKEERQNTVNALNEILQKYNMNSLISVSAPIVSMLDIEYIDTEDSLTQVISQISKLKDNDLGDTPE